MKPMTDESASVETPAPAVQVTFRSRRKKATTIITMKEKKGGLEEADEVAREDVAAGLPPGFVKELTAPPAIFRRRSNSNDIPSLEIKLFIDGSLVVIECLYCGQEFST